jgi:PAS domain S-box-containing protein
VGECSVILPEFSSDKKGDEQRDKLFSQLFDNLASAAVLLDFKSNQIIQVNQAFEQFFGYTPEETQGTDIEELIVPDVEAPVPEDNPHHNDRYSTSARETPRETKSGEIKQVLRTTAPVVIGGNVQYMFVVYFDVTETQKVHKQLKEQKQFYESVIEGLPATFYMFDEQQNTVLWNKNVNEITGFTDKEIENIPPLKLIHADDREKAGQAIQKTLEKGNANGELELLTKDGEAIPYYFASCRLRGAEKRYVIAYGTDVSDMKRVEDDVR